MESDKGAVGLKLEGTHGSVVNPMVIQSDASNVPNIVKFNGSNYPLWSKVLEMHIAGRGKKGFVTGSIKEPKEDSAEYDAWETGNAIVKGWLINSMDPTIMSVFIHLRTAKKKHGVPEWFPELKKKLRAKERAANGASGRRPPMAAATTGNKDAVPTQGDTSQALLTRSNPSESLSNIGTDGRVLLTLLVKL